MSEAHTETLKIFFLPHSHIEGHAHKILAPNSIKNRREGGRERDDEKESLHKRDSGGVRPLSPPRHNVTAPEEPYRARGSICLSLFLYYELLTRTCLSGSSLISLSLLGFRLGSSLFGIPFVKPFLFVNLYFL